MKTLSFVLLTLSILFFGACSSKKVFEPKNVVGKWDKYGSSPKGVVDITSNVAMLENRTVLAKDTIIDIEIAKSYRLLAKSDGWIISSTIDGNLMLQFILDKNIVENFELKKTIASASIKNNMLAVLFADNEMALYNISTKELLLKEQGDPSLAVDSRITSPHFMGELVLFPTLDGKVVIINSKLKKKLRTIIVSSEEHFNNIIYFNVIDNKIIAATGNKILSIATKEEREKYEIRTIAYDNKDIFLTTKQGEVVSITPDLKLNAKTKFPFAHFLGMITTTDKVYLLEKEGYLIELSKDLKEQKIYKANIDNGYVFTADKMFYVEDEFISVE
ncbi:MAG: hypothetical protein NTZ60_03370 [Campylobacterales bacterium]|nr:hypothetical protein [Campylobacterales bacterium]